MPAVPVPVIVICILGGWNFGIAADLLLQGIVFAQISHYIALYKKDILALRAFVWGLLFLTTLKTAQILTIMWTQNVVNFTDIGAATAMFYTFWASKATLILVGLIAFYVQLFFCQRLWALSKNVYLVALLIALFVFGLVAAIVTSTFTGTQSPLGDPWLAAHLSTVLAGDMILCGGTTFYLLRLSKGALPQTSSMLDSFLKITFQSAAPAAICALLNLLGSQAGKTTSQSASIAPGWTLLAILANNALPKLYAISAMWTLNSRNAIRLAREQGQTTSSNEAPSGRRRTNNIELGGLSHHGIVPIQVRTHVQTIQQSDTDMFSPKTHMDDLSERDDQESKN